MEIGFYQILTFPILHPSVKLPQAASQSLAKLSSFNFSFSISNLSLNELLLYLWMSHIKFSSINFEMDFKMGPKLLSNAWESHLDYCISLIT